MPSATKTRSKISNKWWEKSPSAPEGIASNKKMLQTINFKLGSFDDQNRTFTAIASTPVTDRQGDVIDQAGWDLSAFMVNPVIPWAHDYGEPPVARAIEIGVDAGVLKFVYQAPPAGMNEFADLIWDYYRHQFMFAFSVGFIPKNQEGNTFTECELLEISAVVVPANPQALALAYKMGVGDKKSVQSLRTKMQASIKMLDDVIALEKGALSPNIAINDDESVSWDSGKAIANIKDWASDSDGNIDFDKYAKCFFWVDPDNKDKQGGYKLPFADIFDGEPKAVWRAVSACMESLLGARGGVDIPEDDKKPVYDAIAKYYKKFDKEVPDFKSLQEGAIMKAIKTSKLVEKMKGAVADELASEQSLEDKMNAMSDIWDIWWAFVDTYFSEDKTADDLPALLSETLGLLEPYCGGQKSLTSNSTSSEDKDMTTPSQKSGAEISSANKEKLKAVHDYLKSVQGEMGEHMETLKAMFAPDSASSEDDQKGTIKDDVETKAEDEESEAEGGEANSEDENPSEGADHEEKGIGLNDEVDPENLTPEQAEFIAAEVNKELNLSEESEEDNE